MLANSNKSNFIKFLMFVFFYNDLNFVKVANNDSCIFKMQLVYNLLGSRIDFL